MADHRGLEPGHLRDVALPAAKAGRRVLVVPVTQDAGDALFEALDPTELDDVTHVVRTRGRECVRFANGGSLRIVSAGGARRGGARGTSADVVIVDGGALPDERLERELAPTWRHGGSLVVAPLG
ncbi:hypothetical protein ACX12M_17205 [Cellulosimicrobium cellulans]